MKTKVISAMIGGALGLSLALCGELTRGDTRVYVESKPATPIVIEQTTATTEARTDSIKMCDVPLNTEFQKWLINHCYDRSISPYLIMAICEQESDYNSLAVGDNGRSIGLMQIQQCYHVERMAELNVTDLTDAQSNVIVGVDYLLELFNKNPSLEWVLMAYNGGEAYADRMTAKGKTSEYATEVISRCDELER